MSIDTPLESASLLQLQQTPIDNVLNIIDEGLVHLPTYRELYYRWERQQWQSQEIDFSEDQAQWAQMSEQERNDRIYGLASFFQGEACVTDTLALIFLAMPDEEMRIFLTTQLVDEARHTVFFARFFKDVLQIDEGRMEETLAVARQYMNEKLKYILLDSLSEVSEAIRQEPTSFSTLCAASRSITSLSRERWRSQVNVQSWTSTARTIFSPVSVAALPPSPVTSRATSSLASNSYAKWCRKMPLTPESYTTRLNILRLSRYNRSRHPTNSFPTSCKCR